MRGVFFGSSQRVAEIVSKQLNIELVVVEQSAFSHELHDFACYEDIEFKLVTDIEKQVLDLNDFDIGVSYGFGQIFPESVISKFRVGLLNIHTGDLPQYRSRHPISWAIINGEKQIGVTIHKVDQSIDRGILLHKFYVDRVFADDLESLQAKIEDSLENEFNFALEALKNYEDITLGKGTYYPRIDHTFGSVDPANYTAKEIFGLFTSQKTYGGVNLISGHKTICHMYSESLAEFFEGYEVIECLDGRKVAVK